jgi:hypothetical protein
MGPFKPTDGEWEMEIKRTKQVEMANRILAACVPVDVQEREYWQNGVYSALEAMRCALLLTPKEQDTILRAVAEELRK